MITLMDLPPGLTTANPTLWSGYVKLHRKIAIVLATALVTILTIGQYCSTITSMVANFAVQFLFITNENFWVEGFSIPVYTENDTHRQIDTLL